MNDKTTDEFWLKICENGPLYRYQRLEMAMDLLTLQITKLDNILEPSMYELKLAQCQVRLLGSQIRSYEKLAALKKNHPIPEDRCAGDQNTEPMAMSAGGGERSRDKAASEPDQSVPAEMRTTRAERRRMQRLAAKQQKKNRSVTQANAQQPEAAACAETTLQKTPAIAA